MPPPVPKKGKQYKASIPSKDIIPNNFKGQIREGVQFKIPEQCQIIPTKQFFQEYDKIEEWPGDELARNFDFNIQNAQNQIFTDAHHSQLKLTPCFNQQLAQNLVFWRRPNEFIKAEIKEVKEMQTKFNFKRRSTYVNNLINSRKYLSIPELTGSPSKNKESFTFQEEKVEIRVFDYTTRQETQEEYEQRIKIVKQELEKKAQQKQKGKKEEPQEDYLQYQQVKEVRLSNIDMSFPIPDDAKWIASQLQMIKDRSINDCYTNKPIWTKIYPQQDNIPVFNQSGKYWVKLYYMGKERKVEIDDKMPVNYNGQSIFPRSIKKEEIWSYIFSKAILKVIEMSQNVNNIRSLVGSGFIMYALTGLQSQCIPISILDPEQANFIKEMLSDSHYSNSDIYVSCYASVQQAEIRQQSFQDKLEEKVNDSGSKRKPQRNLTVGGLTKAQMIVLDNLKKADNVQDDERKQEDEFQSPKTKKTRALTLFQQVGEILNIKNNNSQSQQEKPNYVIPGFAYPVIESFCNDGFNMVYAQKKSEKEIKYRKEFMELVNANISKMSKDQKIETRKRKKELKDKIFEEEKKRIELINKPPIQYLFFKLKTAVAKVPLLNIFSCFTHEEIQIAKTCQINKLIKPPNYQESQEIKDDAKSLMSQIQKNANNDDFLHSKPLEDFSSVQNLVQPLNRGLGGIWVQDVDIQNIFQHFQIYYNPNRFAHNKVINVSQSEEFELTIGEESEVLIIQKSDNEEQNIISLLFSFILKESKTAKIVPEPYCILQKFDFQQFCSVYEYPLFKGNQSCQLLQLENKNHVFKILPYTPVTYSLSVSSNNQFRTCSITNYLTEYEGYQVKSYNIEYNAFEQNKPNEVSFVLKLKCHSDKQLLKYLRLKVKEQNDQQGCEMLQTIEGVHKNLYESSFLITSYLRISLKQNTTYYLILEGVPPYNVPEGVIQADFYIKNPIEFENMDHVEPLKYFDRYIPSKYGIIFREKLYVSELTICSLSLRIGEVILQKTMNNIQNAADKKKGKEQPQQDLQERQMEEKALVKLELLEDDVPINYNYGINRALLSNCILKPNKVDQRQYILQATFDLNESPWAQTLNHKTESIHWFLKVFSTENIVFSKDTDKEDREKEVKRSWEEKEPGREEKAKKSRRKYEILLKKQQGQELTEEENQIINEPRLTKKQREELGQQNKDKKQPQKKEEKKPPAKKGGNNENINEQKNNEMKQTFPQSSQHQMREITAFLNHLEQPRINEQFAIHSGQIQTRTQENIQEIKENSLLSQEEVIGMLQRNQNYRDDVKHHQQEQINRIINQLAQDRQTYKETLSKLIEQREEVKQRLSVRNSKEKELIEIIKQQKISTNIQDFEKMIQLYSEIEDANKNIIETAQMILTNSKITTLQEKINDNLGNFNIDGLKECQDEIQKYSVQGIEQEIIDKMNEMLEEASQNPNFVAEKQAELKKAGKKGKK